MALANFFDKAALAASQILQGFDRRSFEQQLESSIILVGFDSFAINSREGLASLDMVIRLLGRLYPKMVIKALDAEAQGYVPVVKGQLIAINPHIELLSEDASPTIAVIIGNTSLTLDQPAAHVFYIGSSGWIAKLSSNRPLGSNSSNNPFGAGAAACLGAANVFRAVFASMLPDAELDGEINLSLVDYTIGEQLTTEYPELPDIINFSETILVGLGAVGNGFIWAVSKLTQLQGTLHLVEHDPIDLSNLQRYVLTSQDDIDGSKVDLGIKFLNETGLTTIPHRGKWNAFLANRQDWKLPRVAVAVDSAEDRIAIQAAIPSKIVNAWTQAYDLGISRHNNFLEDACLACLYLPKEESLSESAIIAEALGLPEPEVRLMLVHQAVVDLTLATRIATAKDQPLENLMPLVGKPLRNFYQKTICGGIILSSGNGEQNETPMAFQSALAGIMLAGELIQEDLGLREKKLATSTRINLLSSVGKYLNVPVQKQKDKRCLCNDKHYQQAFKAKYNSEEVAIS
ncbi:E2 ligase fold family C protein [Adhaeribacter aquaticus]|uniref:E2 ligase fold family C protein n=1 Tax=Adhaeribacter aquaticus TaxID=299567 RepID=UPI000410505B|nr:E2 ligase fold family C protein [Adhaeribacter aquaticus]